MVGPEAIMGRNHCVIAGALPIRYYFSWVRKAWLYYNFHFITMRPDVSLLPLQFFRDPYPFPYQTT